MRHPEDRAYSPARRGIWRGTPQALSSADYLNARAHPPRPTAPQISPPSSPPAKPDNLSAVPLRRAPWRQLFELHHRLAFRRNLQAQLAARVGFAIERLRDGRRAARLAQVQDFHFEFTAVVGDPQHVAD